MALQELEQETSCKLEECNEEDEKEEGHLVEYLRKAMRSNFRVYSNGMVVPVPTPDFTMPYNVLCMSGTVLMVFVAGLAKVLYQKTSPEGASETGGASKRMKLGLVLVGVGLFGVAVYLDESFQEQVVSFLADLGLWNEWGISS